MLNNMDQLSPHNLNLSKEACESAPITRTKVVILCGAAAACVWPRDDETWEVWGCNALWSLARDSENRFRADRWFELHPWFAQSLTDKYLLAKSPVPVYMLDLDEREPKDNRMVSECVGQAMAFPLVRLLEAGLPDYFCCTFAYQIALAMLLGFKEIALVGVYLKHKREGIIERANVEFWMAYAMGHGIAFHCPPIHTSYGKVESPLCRTPYRYGYDYLAEKSWGEQYCVEVADGIYKGWKST